MDRMIGWYEPAHVVCLGDSFHDAQALNRMQARDLSCLQQMMGGVRKFSWIIGNHDRSLYQDLPLPQAQSTEQLVINSITLTHEPEPNAQLQIFGHFHPKYTFKKGRVRLSGKSFVVNNKAIVMPAFGTYTGGLEVHSPDFQAIVGKNNQYFMLKNGKIWLLA
jgi:uncharacterized protein